MNSYNNIPTTYPANKYGYYGYNEMQNASDDRFVGGLLAPLFLGGVAGYAIGYNRPDNNQGGYYYPYPPMPIPMYTNNYYYPYY